METAVRVLPGPFLTPIGGDSDETRGGKEIPPREPPLVGQQGPSKRACWIRERDMTPQTRRMLTIHDETIDDHAVVQRRPLAIAGSLVTLPTRRLVEDQPGEYAHSALLRRESLHRRLLGAFDVFAAMASLLFVLTATGAGDPILLALAFSPLVVVLFKIAGLYDRDLMRLGPSPTRR